MSATKILVVDDDPFMRDIIGDILRSTEYDIETADNGADALDKLIKYSGFALIVSDLTMPVMDGMKLLEKVRELDAEIPFIVLTGNSEISIALTAIKNGANDYLIKDENIQDTILLSVDRVLEKKKILDQNRKLNDFIKNALKKYISPEYVEMLVNKPDMLFLGGEEREISILFTDIEGFTTISEKLQPKDLVAHLNEYLNGMTEILLKNKGTLDKYEGDSLVAFWNAPLEQTDHVVNCLTAVLEMAEFSDRLSLQFQGDGKPPFKTRMGVNNGKAIVGNIGSKDRFNYTAIGDQVNLASRLEGLNKVYGTSLLITQSTYELSKNKFRARELDLMRVKGKAKPVNVLELLGKCDQVFNESFEKMLVFFEKGLAAYINREWTEACRCFDAALRAKVDDAPSRIYLGRCQTLSESPPPDDWDGVFDFRLNRRKEDYLSIRRPGVE